MNTVGSRIRLRRRDIEITQKKVASALHISPTIVAQWEDDETQPEESLLPDIAEILECSVEFLLGQESIDRPSDSLGARIRSARNVMRINQKELAKACGWTGGQRRISNYERNEREPGLAEIRQLSDVLKVDPEWLAFAINRDGSCQTAGDVREDRPNYHEVVELSYSQDLASRGVFVPVYFETDSSELLQTAEDDRPHLIFPLSHLQEAGVESSRAICLKITGNAMKPVIPAGSYIGIDTAATNVIDGEMYLIAQGPLLRVRVMQRLSDGYRLKPFNTHEFIDESVEGQSAEELNVIGRVFWISAII